MSSQDAAELGAELTPIFRRRRSEEQVPGLAVGILDAQGGEWSGGFGTLAAGDARPVETTTMFSVQSTSKLITSTALLAAVERGLIALDGTVAEMLPGFTVRSAFQDAPERMMTLRSLLHHTAGFTHEAPVGSNYRVGREGFAAHVASIGRTWLRFPVNHHHEYSNLSVDLAGAILQRATGMRFADAVRSLLFNPLGMRHATFAQPEIQRTDNRARGSWRRAAAAGRRLPVRIPMIPSGGLYTSVDDALRIVRLHLGGGGPIISPVTHAEMELLPQVTSTQTEGYGLCVYVDRWDGIPVRHHGGSGFGFHAQLFWLPEQGVGGVILTNSLDHDLQNELSRLIARTVAGGRTRTRAERAVIGGPPRDAAGSYVGRLGDLVEVSIENSTAVLTGEPGLVGDTFRFLPGPSGATHYLQNLRDGSVRYRTEPADRAPLALPPGLSGRYEARMAGTPVGEYEIRNDEHGPRVRVPGGSDLALFPQAEGFRSSTGETLLAGPDGPTYAEIPLHPIPCGER